MHTIVAFGLGMLLGTLFGFVVTAVIVVGNDRNA